MTLGWCVETYLEGCLTCRVSKDKYKSKFVQNPPKRAWAPLSPAIQGFAGHDWRQQWHALLQPKRDRVQQELGVLPSIVQLLGCLQVGTVIRLLNNLANVLVQMHSSIVQLKIRLICPFFLLGEYGSHIVHQWSSMTWCTDLPSRAKKPVEQSAIRSCPLQLVLIFRCLCFARRTCQPLKTDLKTNFGRVWIRLGY